MKDIINVPRGARFVAKTVYASGEEFIHMDVVTPMYFTEDDGSQVKLVPVTEQHIIVLDFIRMENNLEVSMKVELDDTFTTELGVRLLLDKNHFLGDTMTRIQIRSIIDIVMELLSQYEEKENDKIDSIS